MELELVQNLTLDFCRNEYKTVIVKQYDKNSRHLRITCTNDGNEFKLNPSIHKCHVKMMAPDNRPIYNGTDTVTINEDGTVSVVFNENMVNVGGKGLLELVFLDVYENTTLSTMILNIVIISSVYPDDTVIATPEFSALTEAMLNVEGVVEAASDAYELAEDAYTLAETAKDKAIEAYSLAETADNKAEDANTLAATAYELAGITEGKAEEADEKANTAISIAKGKNQAHVFTTTAAMQSWLSNASNKGIYQKGDNLYIVDVGVPDWWIAEVLETADTDTGYYYKIAQLETQKVDLTEYDNAIREINNTLGTLTTRPLQTVVTGTPNTSLTFEQSLTLSKGIYLLFVKLGSVNPSNIKRLNLIDKTNNVSLSSTNYSNNILYVVDIEADNTKIGVYTEFTESKTVDDNIRFNNLSAIRLM